MARTGEMNKYVAVQKYTKTRDAEGGFIQTWATENQVWAKINPLSASERLDTEQVSSVLSHRISMRYYSPGITAKDRITWNSRTFYITSVVNPGERGCDTVLDCREEIN
jgi:SPP1 family predicted phage head-tail adaptor